MQEFCSDAAAFLAAAPQHVVVVHCKAGKGRTGMLICALLLHLVGDVQGTWRMQWVLFAFFQQNL